MGLLAMLTINPARPAVVAAALLLLSPFACRLSRMAAITAEAFAIRPVGITSSAFVPAMGWYRTTRQTAGYHPWVWWARWLATLRIWRCCSRFKPGMTPGCHCPRPVMEAYFSGDWKLISKANGSHGREISGVICRLSRE